MKRRDVLRILTAKYDDYARQVIERIKKLPPECRQSGDDSLLEDVWEEWKYQVQRRESVLFNLYEETFRDICTGVVESLPPHERELLWLCSDGSFNHDQETGPPAGNQVVEDVADELYQRVCNIAADEELKVDPDNQPTVNWESEATQRLLQDLKGKVPPGGEWEIVQS